MEKKHNLMKMKRNYSDSPFSNFNNYNQLNTHKRIKSNIISYLSDSSNGLEQSENTFEEFRKIIKKKDNKLRKYIKKINDLLFKAEEDKYKFIKLEKVNKHLKQKIENLQQELMKKELILQKKGINEDDTYNQDYSNSEGINLEYLEKIF